jgi:hypothetical protein
MMEMMWFQVGAKIAWMPTSIANSSVLANFLISRMTA